MWSYLQDSRNHLGSWNTIHLYDKRIQRWSFLWQRHECNECHKDDWLWLSFYSDQPHCFPAPGLCRKSWYSVLNLTSLCSLQRCVFISLALSEKENWKLEVIAYGFFFSDPSMDLLFHLMKSLLHGIFLDDICIIASWEVWYLTNDINIFVPGRLDFWQLSSPVEVPWVPACGRCYIWGNEFVWFLSFFTHGTFGNQSVTSTEIPLDCFLLSWLHSESHIHLSDCQWFSIAFLVKDKTL